MTATCGGKLYELRQYRVAAQDFPRFRALAIESLHVRVKRSRLIGFWAIEIGGVNHVFHIWEYDSLAHRKEVRDEMSANPDWLVFLKQAAPAFHTMDNWLCRPLRGEFAAGLQWSDTEFYKLTTVRYLQSDSQASAREKFMSAVQGCGKVKAALETVIGNGREFTLLESSDSLDSFLATPCPFDEELGVAVETKILYPFPWNQWVAEDKA